MLRKSAVLTLLVLPVFAALAAGGVGAAAATAARSSPPSPRQLASPRGSPSLLRTVTSTTSTASTIACDGSYDVVASPNGTGHNDIFATSVVSANDVWAVGDQSDSLGNARTLAEHWNGSSWTIVATPNPSSVADDVYGVAAISSTDVWIVGDYWDNTIGEWLEWAAHWNGSAWNIVSLLNYGFFLAVTAVASNDVWAVGTSEFAPYTTVIDHWNGSSWSQGSGLNPGGYDNELFYVSAWSTSDVWAVGIQQASSGSASQSLAEHWNGSSWSVVPTPNDTGANSINAVAALEGGHAVGVGSAGFVSGVTAAHGEAWDLLASGTSTDAPLDGPGSGDNVLEGVAASGAGVWAVGFWRSTTTSARQTLAWPATWNASTHTLTWAAVGTSASPGTANSVLFAVAAVSPSVFWAAGYYNSGGYDRSLIESYCGLQLNAAAPANVFLGSGFSVTVTAKNPNGTTATGYLGTIHFTSTDTHAVLPSDYTFTPSDAGVHTFSGVVLNTPYLQTITTSDTTTPFISATAALTAWCPGACAGPSGTASTRGTNPGSSGPPDPRGTSPSAGAAPPGPPGARIPQVRSTGTSSLQPATAKVADAVKPAAANPPTPYVAAPVNSPVQNGASTVAYVARPRLDATTTQPPTSQEAAANLDVPLAAAGLLGLLTLLLAAARRRKNRRLDGSTEA